MSRVMSFFAIAHYRYQGTLKTGAPYKLFRERRKTYPDYGSDT